MKQITEKSSLSETRGLIFAISEGEASEPLLKLFSSFNFNQNTSNKLLDSYCSSISIRVICWHHLNLVDFSEIVFYLFFLSHIVDTSHFLALDFLILSSLDFILQVLDYIHWTRTVFLFELFDFVLLGCVSISIKNVLTRIYINSIRGMD